MFAIFVLLFISSAPPISANFPERVFGLQLFNPQAPEVPTIAEYVQSPVVSNINFNSPFMKNKLQKKRKKELRVEAQQREDTINAAIHDIPDDLYPLYERPEDVTGPIAGDFVPQCPVGFELIENECILTVYREPMLSCPYGTYRNKDLECVQSDSVPPDFICPAFFDPFLRGCIRRTRLTPQLSCPPGYQQFDETCLHKTFVRAQPECPANYILSSDGMTDGSTAECIKYESTSATVECGEGFIPLTPTLRSALEIVSGISLFPNSYPIEDPLCVAEKEEELVFKCPPGYIKEKNQKKKNKSVENIVNDGTEINGTSQGTNVEVNASFSQIELLNLTSVYKTRQIESLPFLVSKSSLDTSEDIIREKRANDAVIDSESLIVKNKTTKEKTSPDTYSNSNLQQVSSTTTTTTTTTSSSCTRQIRDSTKNDVTMPSESQQAKDEIDLAAVHETGEDSTQSYNEKQVGFKSILDGEESNSHAMETQLQSKLTSSANVNPIDHKNETPFRLPEPIPKTLLPQHKAERNEFAESQKGNQFDLLDILFKPTESLHASSCTTQLQAEGVQPNIIASSHENGTFRDSMSKARNESTQNISLTLSSDYSDTSKTVVVSGNPLEKETTELVKILNVSQVFQQEVSKRVEAWHRNNEARHLVMKPFNTSSEADIKCIRRVTLTRVQELSEFKQKVEYTSRDTLGRQFSEEPEDSVTRQLFETKISVIDVMNKLQQQRDQRAQQKWKTRLQPLRFVMTPVEMTNQNMSESIVKNSQKPTMDENAASGDPIKIEMIQLPPSEQRPPIFKGDDTKVKVFAEVANCLDKLDIDCPRNESKQDIKEITNPVQTCLGGFTLGIKNLKWISKALEMQKQYDKVIEMKKVNGKNDSETEKVCRRLVVRTGRWDCPKSLKLRKTLEHPSCDGIIRIPAPLKCPLISTSPDDKGFCQTLVSQPTKKDCPPGYHDGPQERRILGTKEIDWGGPVPAAKFEGLCERVEYADFQTICPKGYALEGKGRTQKKACSAEKQVAPVYLCEPGYVMVEPDTEKTLCAKTLEAAPTLVAQANPIASFTGPAIGEVSVCQLTNTRKLSCSQQRRFYGDLTEKAFSRGQKFRTRMDQKVESSTVAN